MEISCQYRYVYKGQPPGVFSLFNYVRDCLVISLLLSVYCIVIVLYLSGGKQKQGLRRLHLAVAELGGQTLYLIFDIDILAIDIDINNQDYL